MKSGTESAPTQHSSYNNIPNYLLTSITIRRISKYRCKLSPNRNTGLHPDQGAGDGQPNSAAKGL